MSLKTEEKEITTEGQVISKRNQQPIQIELIIEHSRACLHLGTTFFESMGTFIISDILKYTSIMTSGWMFIRHMHSNIALKTKLKAKDLKVSPNREDMDTCLCWMSA